MIARMTALLPLVILVVLAGILPAHADWTASGTMLYTDREFDQNGFTGLEPVVPIRYATVEVRIPGQNGRKALLATGATDGNGNFSIFVRDSKVRTVMVRALTTSDEVQNLHVRVQSWFTPTPVYAVASPDFPNHSPGQDLDFGTIVAPIGAGGEGFNIYDAALRAIEFIASLNGTNPGVNDLLTMEWDSNSGFPISSYDSAGMKVHVGDPSGYNDTVISHELGHYAFDLGSAHASPGGAHFLTDCNQDLRLAYEEGRATWFGQSVRRFHNLPNPELYVKTTGAPGPGNLDFYFDVEAESPYFCEGASSEVAVYTALWDINDSVSTQDGTPGSDDETLARPALDNWDVDTIHIPTTANKTLEDFWAGWFGLAKGAWAEMVAAFQRTGVEFYPDVAEPNDGTATAFPIAASGSSYHNTFFSDPDDDGVGATDTDYFSFTASAGIPYSIETTNLWGNADTSLELLAGNGTTVLASNDDRAAGDPSSLIDYTPSTGGTLYVRASHAPGSGRYGSYDLVALGNALVDDDQDSYLNNVDCDDSDPAVNPGATEICNGVDDDCTGGIDDGFDVDSDSFTTCGGDCNDADPAVNPGAVEVCNGIDDDCAGGIDEGFDQDADGYRTCDGDCDDGDPGIHPGAVELCNGVDDNCAAGVDEGFDVDDDSFTTCGGDCDDSDPAVNPGAVENCSNGIDDDCNTLIDASDPLCQIDTVVITQAEYKSRGSRLTVWATSTAAPAATLTVVGYGTMSYDSSNGRYTFSRSRQSEPSTVTVTSSHGGTDTAPVELK